ncbi:MAG: carbohydrate ABC transporter permease, partial [Clostridiaceae bacterium]|nr:carbohydrate ABC transporter permease [Clostridiaceae bacterium]
MALARKRRIADSTEDRVFYILNAVILTLLLFVTLYPLYFVIIASVSDYRAVGTGQVLFWPKGFSLFAYQKVFQKQSVLIGYRNTIFYTIVGTAINLGLTLLTGYALSVKFPGRRIANFFIVFTMYFSGGIIPTYFVIRDLHLLNTIWVMLLPGAISAYNLILTRSFIQSS